MPLRYVAVCGDSDPGTPHREAAREIGRLLAKAGAVVVCGGLGGVMEAAGEGAASAGGTVVGILPGTDRVGANQYLTIALPTGLGQARNAVLATASDAMIAIGSAGWGTLSEIAHARRLGRPVVGLDTWRIDGLDAAGSPAEAVDRVLA
jgi:uncharacterized protein (TIGR00725 family)